MGNNSSRSSGCINIITGMFLALVIFVIVRAFIPTTQGEWIRVPDGTYQIPSGYVVRTDKVVLDTTTYTGCVEMNTTLSGTKAPTIDLPNGGEIKFGEVHDTDLLASCANKIIISVGDKGVDINSK